MAQIYIPRFGQNWERNIVEGTDAAQLARHGLGHYTDTQMPGQVGNFAVAGHRNGYGQPLGDVDKAPDRRPDHRALAGLLVRIHLPPNTKSCRPKDTEVIAANPENPGAAATTRMITLTTCEPKYSTPTSRWIVWGELKYWAKVADGMPQELATTGHDGTVKFAANSTAYLSPAAKMGSLAPLRARERSSPGSSSSSRPQWPGSGRRYAPIRQGERPQPDASIYGTLMRLQPGVLPIRILLTALLLFAAAASLFEWGFPWAASHMPIMQQNEQLRRIELVGTARTPAHQPPNQASQRRHH